MTGFECTISVDDIDETIRAVQAAGRRDRDGQVPHSDGRVGCYFNDPEGNLAGAMQYEAGAAVGAVQRT